MAFESGIKEGGRRGTSCPFSDTGNAELLAAIAVHRIWLTPGIRKSDQGLRGVDIRKSVVEGRLEDVYLSIHATVSFPPSQLTTSFFA